MIALRRSGDRGHAEHGWLDSRHTFSFADYHDPHHMGFRALRVINDDLIAAGQGFPTHPHRDMEIISYVVEGALVHRDSMGNGSVIRPGDVQRMSAGTGVRHSELNGSPTDRVRLLQIWILPDVNGLPPGYEEKRFSDDQKRGRLRLVASRDGHDGSVTVHQDVAVYVGLFAKGEHATLRLAPGRHAWVQIVRGHLQLNGQGLAEGDGASLADEGELTLAGVDDAEVLVFDLA